jgi:iron only hydrogenase large subunit-like protein
MTDFSIKEMITVLKTEKTIALLAPSFVVDFTYPDVVFELRRMGFCKVVELTYAAKLINLKYHHIIKDDEVHNGGKKQFICSNCPSVVKLVENKFPEHKEKLINVASPMVLMSRFVKREFGSNYKTIFIGPCIVKKQEAKESDSVDYAITFVELKELLDYFKENNLFRRVIDSCAENLYDFDKFYNEYTKIYPLTGAVAKTMHMKDILKPEQVIVVDGAENIEKAITEMEGNPNIKFIDALFCNGGCIGGLGIASQDSIEKRKVKVIAYRELAEKHKMGKKFGKFKYAEDLEFRRKVNDYYEL